MIHSTSVSLRWSDTDSQGHINHALLLTLLEEARSRWITSGSPSLVSNIVAARIEIDYHAPLLYSEGEVTVMTRVDRVGTKSFRLSQSLTSARADGPTFACANVVIVAFTPNTQTSRTLSSIERAWLLRYAEERPSKHD